MKKFTRLFCLIWLAAAGLIAGGFAARGAEITLHPKAEKFPAQVPGPFVHLADGGILTLSGTEARRSDDGGATWQSFTAIPADKFRFGDYSIVRTDDALVAAFCNAKEIKKGTWGEGNVTEWEIPVYSIRSLDGGKTWSEPLPIQRDWVGALRAMVVLDSGRIVLAAMAVQPWQHVIPVYYSDDSGQSWIKTATITMDGSKINDHDGAMEPKLLQRADGSVFMLIRTTKGTFYRSISRDGGVTWSKPESTGIENNNSFGELARLADGRWVLIWNRDEKFPAFDYRPDPNDWIVKDQDYGWIRRRNKLSIAFSSDEGETWSEPVVLASTPDEKTWIAYAVFFEPLPGTFWITTQQGDVRMAIQEKDL